MNYEAYENTLAYPRRSDFTAYDAYNAAYNAYYVETHRLEAQFKLDFFAELSIENNPKRFTLFAKAWEHGHSAGYSEVMNCGWDLVELIED